MKYKIRDRVVIKKGLKHGIQYSPYMPADYAEMGGRIVTIKEIRDGDSYYGYYVTREATDDGNCLTDAMILRKSNGILDWFSSLFNRVFGRTNQ